MEHDENKSKNTFSKKGAWLGLLAYIVLIIIIAAILVTAY
jgi:hypothetical protein